MDKYDLEILKNKGKEKIKVTRTFINRKLEDLSLPTVLSKQLLIHCGVALLCIVLLCVVMGTIIGLSCSNDVVDLITNTTMEFIDIKNQKLTLAQDYAHIGQSSINTMLVANDNGFIDNSVVVLFNTNEQKIDYYASETILSKSDRLDEWYQEQTQDTQAVSIFSIPKGLTDFAEEHSNRDLCITAVSLTNNVLIPEKVEARQGKRIIAEWTNQDAQNPNRPYLEGEFRIALAGITADDPLLAAITAHKYNLENSIGVVEYDKSQWDNNVKVASKAFTVNGVNYEAHLVYEYAGLRPLTGYIIFASLILMGVAVIVSLSQTKKIREF